MSSERDPLTHEILGAAIATRKRLGHVCLEHAYQRLMCHHLLKRGLAFESQKSFAIEDDGIFIENAYKADIVVERRVIVELKTVQEIHPVHRSQVLTYLRLSGLHVGLLINFHAVPFTDGIVRLVL